MTSPTPGPARNTVQFSDRGSAADVETGQTFQPKFDEHGLIPAIVQDASDGEVLMFAFMNRDALAETLATGIAHFWSRSRAKLWRKGEESGNELRVIDARTDCDQDVVLLRVEIAGAGVACHTGARSCFYRTLATGNFSDGPLRLTRHLSTDPGSGT